MSGKQQKTLLQTKFEILWCFVTPVKKKGYNNANPVEEKHENIVCWSAIERP